MQHLKILYYYSSKNGFTLQKDVLDKDSEFFLLFLCV